MKTAVASTFADPSDLAAFKRCKARGGTDHHCFSEGDNGIGLWGDPTVPGSGPACALPPEEWEPFYHQARNKPVKILYKGTGVIALLKDTLPHGSKRIDLNSDTCKALGITPPALVEVEWEWL